MVSNVRGVCVRVCVCFVLLPCLCNVMATEDALRATVYMYLLQTLLFCHPSVTERVFHVATSSQVSHLTVHNATARVVCAEP